MKNIISVFLLIFLLFAVNSCSVVCTDGEGPVKSETRNPGEFDEIDLSIPAELIVQKGNSFSVSIEAQENLLEKIILKIRNDELVIKSKGCINPDSKIRINIDIPVLNALELYGSGVILIPDTFQTEKLRLEINGSGKINAKLIAAEINAEINGSGNIHLAGSANKFETEINGSGDVNAFDMPCNSSSVQVNGSGDVRTYAIQQLDVHVNGSGSVHYKGKPAVTTKIFGSGKVVDEN